MLFRSSADDEHRQGRVQAAEFADELRAAQPWHDVVGDDKVNRCGKLILPKLLDGATWVQGGDDMVSSAFEDSLPRSCLHCIVIDEENGWLFLTGDVRCGSRVLRGNQQSSLLRRCRG